MTIPALFAVSSGNTLSVRDTFFDCLKVGIGPEYDYKAVSSKFKDTVRKPVVVVDSNSFNSECFDETVMKKMAIRGNDIWFMTHIECVDDVFDSFNTVAENLLAPLHTIADYDELTDILSVSDSVIPAIFVNMGKGIDINGISADPIDILDKIIDIGYGRVCVVDTDDSIGGDIWSAIYDEHPATLPFVSKQNDNVYFGDFRNIITPPEF